MICIITSPAILIGKGLRDSHLKFLFTSVKLVGDNWTTGGRRLLPLQGSTAGALTSCCGWSPISGKDAGWFKPRENSDSLEAVKAKCCGSQQSRGHHGRLELVPFLRHSNQKALSPSLINHRTDPTFEAPGTSAAWAEGQDDSSS